LGLVGVLRYVSIGGSILNPKLGSPELSPVLQFNITGVTQGNRI